jgi:hypothetical protein
MSENFFRHLCELVLRHQMRVSNYFVNSFYSVDRKRERKKERKKESSSSCDTYCMFMFMTESTCTVFGKIMGHNNAV